MKIPDRRLSKESGGMSSRKQSLLLNKLATFGRKESVDNREYRLVTAGEDGYVFFWNLSFDQINDARAHFYGQFNPSERRTSAKLHISSKAKSLIGGGAHHQRRIPEMKPKYELPLSGYAQI